MIFCPVCGKYVILGTIKCPHCNNIIIPSNPWVQ